jgi:predicted DNA-binding protein YlxM (UPF0122 family)
MSTNIGKEMTEKQIRAIEYLINGESMTNTARLVGVTRQTIDNWKKDKYFKTAFDEYAAALKTLADTEMNSKAKSLLDNLIKIALTGKSEKNRLDATIYGLNRIYGAPTNKTENVNTNIDNNASSSDKADIEQYINELDNNVIKINKAI